MEKEKIVHIWAENHRKGYNVMFNFAGLIMKDEIWAAIRKMKLGKATGLDSISMERLEVLKDYEN